MMGNGAGRRNADGEAEADDARQQRLVVEAFPSIAPLRGHHGSMVP
jgi:hypothetical protein